MALGCSPEQHLCVRAPVALKSSGIAARDPLDRQIVSLLVEDGRMPLSEVGQRIGLSAPAVKRRFDRLRADGVLRGFTAQVDPAALGWHTEALVELICEVNTPPSELRRTLTGRPEVVAAYTVTGDADAIVHLRAEDVEHLERAIEDLRLAAPVARSRTTIVLTRLVEWRGG